MKKNYLLFLVMFAFWNISAQVKYKKGMDFDDQSYSETPKKAKLTRGLEVVPSAISLKEYAPIPVNQGAYGTCTSWAVAYCGRTIMDAISNNWKETSIITKNAYSAPFLFRQLKPKDSVCNGGSSISEAFNILKQQGALKLSETADLKCFGVLNTDQIEKASQYKIKDFMRLFDIAASKQIKIQSIRKSLSEKKPVVIGLNCPDSFNNAKEVWLPTESFELDHGGHAMCVVGYDDQKFGGAFEIQNSWGTDWGNKGYIWIKYDDFANFTKYAFQFVDLPEPKPLLADLSGNIKLLLSDGSEMPVNLSATKVAAGYTTQNSYTYGTRFRIYISNNEPAYVYALSTDLSNSITKIFPYDNTTSAALTDKKNEIPIPDEDHFIQFDNQPGTDILCVLYSRNELNLDELVSKIAQEEGSFVQKVYKVLENKLVDEKNITYSKEKISFKGFSKGKTIIPLIVEMNHQ